MQPKLSAVLLKGKNISEVSDMNKMSVHLEQILMEKEGVDLKVRQSITDALLKSANFIILCGYDSGLLSELFKIISYMESVIEKERPVLFLYEEPGRTIFPLINSLMTSGSDLERIDIKVLDKVVDTWTYNDIIGYINVSIKQIGLSANTANVEPGELGITE
jgi:hypothetical protein